MILYVIRFASARWIVADTGRIVLALAILGTVVATAHLLLSYFGP